MNTEFKVIGKPVPPRDAREKVNGSAKYSADIKLDGMLHAKILGSPYPHARITKIDISQAEKIEGVENILTYDNTSKSLFYPVNTKPMYVLDEQVRYVGEPVAVVAAETEEIAEEVLAAIKVDYEELPAVFDPVEAAKPEAPKLYPEGNIANPLAGQPLIEKWGDTDKAFEEADVIVEGTFETPAHVHAPMEPRACIASWDGRKLSAWVSTQFPHRVKDDLATVLELPISKVRVISRYLGGGFGSKRQEEYPLMAALLSVRTNRPVKLEYSRDEEMIRGRRRYSSIENFKLAARQDGSITAIKFETYYDVGAHGNFIGGSIGFWGGQLFMYKFENAMFKAYDVNTNLPTAQPARGVQYPAYHFGLEQLVDQIAEKLGIDPIEIRLKNTYRTGDKTKPYGTRLSNYVIDECIDKGVKASGFWDRWQGWNKPVKAENAKMRGTGVALSIGWCEWMRQTTNAIVKIYPEATAELIMGTQDLGTGCNTTLPQVVAEELGIPFDKVMLTVGDTGLTPSDHGSCASRTLYVGGAVAQRAAQKVKKALINTACIRLNVNKKDIKFQGGEINIKGRRVPLSEIIKEPIAGVYRGKPIERLAPLHPVLYVGGALFHVAEVEVDIETGEITVLRYTVVQDVGKAINPSVVEGQIYGAVVQGLGYALREELLFDKDSHQPLNTDFLRYNIYNLQDVPNIQVNIVESNEPSGPFGAMGIGEHCTNPVAGAVANAVYNAIGTRLYEIPMTPQRVLKALGKI